MSWEIDRLGTKLASTFPGFCKKHDSELFEPIESGFISLSEREVALLSLRTLSRERYTKLAQIRMTTDAKASSKFIQKEGHERFFESVEQMNLAANELKHEIETLFHAIHNADYSKLTHRIFELESNFPIAFTGSFSPEHDIKYNEILPTKNENWALLSAFCGRLGEKSYLVLSGGEGLNDKQLDVFFKSLDDVDFVPETLALNLALEYIENTFFKPSWLENLSAETKKQIKEKSSSLTDTIRSENYWSELPYPSLV